MNPPYEYQTPAKVDGLMPGSSASKRQRLIDRKNHPLRHWKRVECHILK